MSIQLAHLPEEFNRPKTNTLAYQMKLGFIQVGLWLFLVLIAFFLALIPGPEPINSPPAPFTIIFLLTMTLIAFHITVAIHELGHVVAGLLVGFRLIVVTAGPFRLARESGRLKFRLHLKRITNFFGYTICLPTREDHPPTHWLLLIVGGPLATLLQLLCFLAIRLTLREQIVSYWLVHIIGVLIFTSFTALLSTTIPLTPMGIPNDARRMISWFKAKAADRQLRITRLMAAMIEGTPPRHLNKEQLTLALQPSDSSDEEVSALWLAYYQALDENNIETAVHYLNQILAILKTRPPAQWLPPYLLETAHFVARYQQNPDLARSWLERTNLQTPSFFTGVEQDLSRLRTEATIYLAEGKLPEANLLARRSLSLLPQVYNLGGIPLERKWLEEIISQTDKAAAMNPLPVNWQPSSAALIRPTRHRSTLVILGSFVLIAFVILVLIIMSIRNENLSNSQGYYERGTQYLEQGEYEQTIQHALH